MRTDRRTYGHWTDGQTRPVTDINSPVKVIQKKKEEEENITKVGQPSAWSKTVSACSRALGSKIGKNTDKIAI